MTSTDNGSSGNQLKKMQSIKDNFGLTKSEFDYYVVKLEQGNEALFTKVFSIHFHDSVSYIRRKFKINQDVAYDTCMDTMLEFRKKILEGKIVYGNLRYLYTRMALNNYVDDVKNSKKRNQAINVFMNGNKYNSVNEQYFFDLIDKTLIEQDNESKKIIDELFYKNKHVNKLAEESGVSNATMRKRKQRILDKLKLTFFEILKSERQ